MIMIMTLIYRDSTLTIITLFDDWSSGRCDGVGVANVVANAFGGECEMTERDAVVAMRDNWIHDTQR